MLVGLAVAGLAACPASQRRAWSSIPTAGRRSAISIVERDGTAYIGGLGGSEAARAGEDDRSQAPGDDAGEERPHRQDRRGHGAWQADGEPVSPDRPAFVDGEETYIDLASAERILGSDLLQEFQVGLGPGTAGGRAAGAQHSGHRGAQRARNRLRHDKDRRGSAVRPSARRPRGGDPGAGGHLHKAVGPGVTGGTHRADRV